MALYENEQIFQEIQFHLQQPVNQAIMLTMGEILGHIPLPVEMNRHGTVTIENADVAPSIRTVEVFWKKAKLLTIKQRFAHIGGASIETTVERHYCPLQIPSSFSEPGLGKEGHC